MSRENILPREDILRMSREAGLNMGTIQQYERFTQLVANALAALQSAALREELDHIPDAGKMAGSEPVLFIHPSTLEMASAHVGAWKPGHELPGYIALYADPPAAQPILQTCNCRWDGDELLQLCTLHEAHADAIHDLEERAKEAEAKIRAQPVKPLTEEEIGELYAQWWDASPGATHADLMRMVEAAHGIKEKT